MKRPEARRRMAATAVTAVTVAIAAVVTPIVIAAPAAAAVTQAYFTSAGGAAQQFVVPPAVTQIFVTAVGGSGGAGASRGNFLGGGGAPAGSVSAALPVTPGQKLNIFIGNAGQSATSTQQGGGGSSSGLVAAGAYVFGGSGGAGDPASLGAGGGGGGATAVSAGSTPLLVAGGGGGGGGANLIGNGGAGGVGGNPAGNGRAGDGPVPGPGGLGAKPGLGVSGQAGQDKLDIAGAGGGGGAGWNIAAGQTGGGARGLSSVQGNDLGDGGGGGGGAGASSTETAASNVHFATSRSLGNGTVFITWDQPATFTQLQGNGFSQVGAPVTFTAALYPGNPVAGEPVATGNVGFFDGGLLLGNVTVSPKGVASFTTSKLTAGLHSITASYYGDSVYAGSTSDALSQEVTAPNVFTSAATLSGVVGAPLSFTVRTTGFPPPGLLAQGKLDGLKLTDHGDGTATLAGTPATAGTFPIKLFAVSIVNPVVSQTLTLTATLKPLAVTTASLPSAFTGQAYTATLAGQGGTPPYAWSLISGPLPKGISLNTTTGALSGTPTGSGTTSFTVKVTDSTKPTQHTATKALSLTAKGIVPSVYVANGANDSVTSYPLSSGNLTPLTRLAGIPQGLNGPGGLVINAAGRVYVTDSGSNAIVEYDRGAVTPTVTVAGSNTGLAGPAGITLDTGGLIYVANRTANSVSVFGGGATGNVGPIWTIAGPDTGLSSPAAVAIDGAGYLWVANASSNSLTAYLPGSSGDAKPFIRIAGPATGLNEPQGLAVDAEDNLLVANTFGESVTTYPLPLIGPDANPNVSPIRTISGSSTGLSFPDGIDVDSSGRIYVANQFDNDITTYAATANGNVTPLTTIAGSNTGLSAPGAIAVTPPLSVLTASLPQARTGHGYRVSLQAGEGTSPYVWKLAQGWLPPGLWLGKEGVVTGTPRHGGRWTFTVLVADSSRPHAIATRSFTLTVAGR